MSNQLQFNGVAVTAPTIFKPSFKDLDSDKSTRNANGYMVRDRIRSSMRTLQFEWGNLTTSQISTILQAVQGVSISVYYPDPMDGQWETRTMYVGNRAAEATYDFDSGLWKGLAFDLIEY